MNVLIKRHEVLQRGLGHRHWLRSTVEKYDLVRCQYVIYLLQLEGIATLSAVSKVTRSQSVHRYTLGVSARILKLVTEMSAVTKEANIRYVALTSFYLYRLK
jgi:hypothetical protein